MDLTADRLDSLSPRGVAVAFSPFAGRMGNHGALLAVFVAFFLAAAIVRR